MSFANFQPCYSGLYVLIGLNLYANGYVLAELVLVIGIIIEGKTTGSPFSNQYRNYGMCKYYNHLKQWDVPTYPCLDLNRS